MAPWDSSKVQSQLRLTAFRLGQLRERNDETSNITKRDVATLISQADISLARIKVEKLVQADKLSGLLERLEFYCSLLQEKSGELGQSIDFESDSPLLEAVCSVMLVASRTELKDVTPLRDMLVQMYGPEFNQLAVKNHADHVPLQVVNALDTRPPSAARVDVYMASISHEYNLSWIPPLLPHQKSHLLSEILDQSTFPRAVNFEELRQICSRGIPQQPPWLRPRVWKLLLGTLSQQKDSWEIEAYSKRRSYYDLASPLLLRLKELPLPSTPLSPADASLLSLAKSLSHLPPELDLLLEQSPLCPFDSNAPDGLRNEAADAVDLRVKLIQGHTQDTSTVNGTPEIRLGPADPTSLQMPQISVSSPIDSPTDDGSRKMSGTVLHPSVFTRSHATSLMRLLYIHMALHPSTPTPYLASVLVPLYVAMIQEVEPSELAHVEADTFWLFTEIWGEVGELSEDEGSQVWVAKLGHRLAWADPELSGDLCRKGLDPTLPHYSYRWLVPVLTRTLPLSSVLAIWDALFAQPARTSDHNAKLEFLVDICTSMLINARDTLFRLGRAAIKSPGLWGDVELTLATPSNIPVEFEEGFTQGMALLQSFPIDELGGPERIIDTAVDMVNQRKNTEKKSSTSFGFGERLRGTVWSNLMTRSVPAEPSIPESDNESEGTPSPEWPDSGAEDEGDTTEKPSALLGKLGSTVWRGLTNQSSMDVPPSPLPPNSPVQPLSSVSNAVEASLPNPSGAEGLGRRLGNSIWRGLTNQSAMDAPPSPTELSMLPSPPHESEGFTSPNSSSGLWNYTGKFKDSDTAASLSKTSSNWTARASTLWRRSNPSSTVSSPDRPSQHSRAGSLGMSGRTWTDVLPKRGSLPTNYDKNYSPPPRPNFRESRYFSPKELATPDSPSRPAAGLSSPLLAKGKSALASLTGNTTATPKSAPRPLLLSSSSLITPLNSHRLSRSPTPGSSSTHPQDTSLFTASTSTSSPVTRNGIHSDRDSEPSSGRFVPLRRVVPPHPPRTSRTGVVRSTTAEAAMVSLGPGHESEPSGTLFKSAHLQHERRTSSADSATRGWSQVELPDSPSTLPSSPPPKTPVTMTNGTNVRVSGGSEGHPTAVVLNVSDTAQHPQTDKRTGRKKSLNTITTSGSPVAPRETASDSSTSQERPPSVRSKRYGQRPTNLRLKKSDAELGRSSPSPVVEQRSNSDGTSLVPESLPDITANTPRAIDFSSEERFARLRKNSRSPRRTFRKLDMATQGSFSSDGDDEGYDEFLSAYESEDGARVASI